MHRTSTMNLTIAEILNSTGGKLIHGNANTPITQISTDSRALKAGDLFIALVGENFDGHTFLEDVRQEGAIGAVVSKHVEVDLPLIIQVKDALIALGDIANHHRCKFHLPVIAITGSNGKTTTKDMTASVLCQRFAVFKSEKNYNNQIGIPQRLLELTDAAEMAVLEIGTNLPGEIERLSQLTAPTVGVITNIGATHLELLGSIEGVAEEKGALLEHVEHAILNADQPITHQLMQRGSGRISTFGWKRDADVSASEIEVDSFGKPSFTLRVSQKTVEKIKLPCVGVHNISNALAAACVGVWAGLTSAEIRAGLESYRPADMRMQLIKYDGLCIINDTYNSNPDSLEYALEFLSNMETTGKRIAILGDMLELGIRSESFHRKAGEQIPSNISLLITVGRRSVEIARGAEGRVESVFSCKSSKSAAQILLRYAQAGDVVLIKGSRGMKLEQILEELKLNT